MSAPDFEFFKARCPKCGEDEYVWSRLGNDAMAVGCDNCGCGWKSAPLPVTQAAPAPAPLDHAQAAREALENRTALSTAQQAHLHALLAIVDALRDVAGAIKESGS